MLSQDFIPGGLSPEPGWSPPQILWKDQSVKLNKLQNSGFSVITAPLIFTGEKALNHKLIHTYILRIQFF